MAPTDGVFFRLNSSGLQGIASFNGAEVSTGVFPLADGTGTWVYTNGKRYQFTVYIGGVRARFWVNDGSQSYLLGSIPLWFSSQLLITNTVGTSTDCTTAIIGNSGNVLILERSGIEIAYSEHIYFTTDESAVRAIGRAAVAILQPSAVESITGIRP